VDRAGPGEGKKLSLAVNFDPSPQLVARYQRSTLIRDEC
jgi:hypothetical protein